MKQIMYIRTKRGDKFKIEMLSNDEETAKQVRNQCCLFDQYRPINESEFKLRHPITIPIEKDGEIIARVTCNDPDRKVKPSFAGFFKQNWLYLLLIAFAVIIFLLGSK